MAVGKSGLGFALTQSIAEIWTSPSISRLCMKLEQIRDHFSQPPWGYLTNKSGLGFALTWSLTGQGNLGQVYSKKGALIDLKMAQQSWRAKSRTYTKFQPNRSNYIKDTANLIGFSTVRKWRYEVTQTWNCVSGVRPCLVHSQNLSNLTVHFDGGQNPYWTAVCPDCQKAQWRASRGFHLWHSTHMSLVTTWD